MLFCAAGNVFFILFLHAGLFELEKSENDQQTMATRGRIMGRESLYLCGFTCFANESQKNVPLSPT
jgi:hypothetical protein